MPLSTHSVHLDGIKTRELERRASIGAESDRESIGDNLDSELADLVPELHQMSIESKHTVRAWPRGRVPYTISVDLQRNHPDICKTVNMALKTFRRQVRSVEWIEQENETDFVEFVYDRIECSSKVGCVGGQQKIKLADWATPGNVLHEMGHAIGLEHEHCRLDRDHFVKVHTDRIQKGVGYNFEITGIPLGPYDYGSIMHYGACGFSIDGRPTIVARPIKGSDQIGQRKEFSEMDLKGIEAIYGPLKCTFEQHGDVYWPQYWFECQICWGNESNYGCCLMCALDCHSGPDHLLVPHQLSAKATFVCDCGRNHHQKAVCTWHSTKTKNVKQPFYNCRDCFQNSSLSCCYQCMKTCHAGHHTTDAGIMKGYCQCGMDCYMNKIACRILNPTFSDRCTYETTGETYPSQHWYECRTCWGGESNYGCCLSCAFNCHRGHSLVYHPEEKFMCDCGRNHHQKAVCTWHSTKTNHVKQPFYHCYDCFTDLNAGCCYQCVIMCHAGHNTKFVGIMMGHCGCGMGYGECGMECCRTSCRIPKPTSESYMYMPENVTQDLLLKLTDKTGVTHHPRALSKCYHHPSLFQQSICTRYSSGMKYVKQPFYHCYDCFTHPRAGCCYQCMQKCHAGHNTRFDGILDAFCDCGLEHCHSSCLIPEPLTCTYESRGEDYHLQYWYHCYTCWGGESNYGCCSYCAFNCHRGHDIVYQPGRKDTAVCDCGRNCHQQAVCTWHSTRRKYVKQPFYWCFDCFTYIFRTPEDVFEGCCYQCMKKCHAGHNTAYAGILDAFCDCGLRSCRIRCSISSPK